MLKKVTLKEAFAAAAEDHTWDSEWTRDGQVAKTLDEWWDEAQTPLSPPDVIFTYDGTRIGRQGADVQHYKRLMYLAEERCSICSRFVDRDAGQRRRVPTNEDKLSSVFCVNCVSGGVIGKVLRS